MRTREVDVESYRRTRRRVSKRPRPGSEQELLRGERCKSGHMMVSFREVPKLDRTKLCSFCGRQKATHKCRSCGAHLCVKTPKEASGGIRYPANGPCCFLRFHGITNFTQ